MKKITMTNFWLQWIPPLDRGFKAWIFITKLTVPAMILIRVLLYFDLIPYVAVIFEPVMALVGLPAEAALVWVSAFLANLYVGLTVYISLIPVMPPLTVSQITALGGLVLLAHSLIVEGQICRGAGLSFWRVTIFRLLAAIFFGVLVNITASLYGWGAEHVPLLPLLNVATDPVPPLATWLYSSAKQLIMILIVIEVLMLVMELIKLLNLNRLIMVILGPPLKLAGVGEKALMVTIFGCVIGLSYGGGLIIAESRSGKISPADIFGALILMAIFHSAIEDTLLMWYLGGSLGWLLGVRLLLALALAALVTRLARHPKWRLIVAGPQLDFQEQQK